MKAREPRKAVSIPARLRKEREWVDVRIRNLSSRGMRIEAEGPPRRGSYVEIFRHHHIIIGRVIWVRGAQAGVKTQDVIDISALVAGKSPNAAPAVAGIAERRASRRGPAKPLHERSRRIATMLQFASLALAAGGCALAGGQVVKQALATPLGMVSNSL